MLLGAVADDLTGATDLSLMLARNGMRTVQHIGVPGHDVDFGSADAVVVALKSRTAPSASAVSLSVEAASALLAQGATQLLFKYCSTFDSTDLGNIGPVADALLELTGAPIAVACPAFPAAGRSIYQGHLFVGDLLLSDSPMKDHPLTPMRDSNLVRVLQQQSRFKVGLVPWRTVSAGVEAVRSALDVAKADGFRLMISDAVRDEDLRVLGRALAGAPLITGGSGISMGLPDNFRAAHQMDAAQLAARMQPPRGSTVILAGSCSSATRSQIDTAIGAGFPALKVNPLDLVSGAQSAGSIANWIMSKPSGRPAIAFSSDEPNRVKDTQERLGKERAGALVERLLADVSVILRSNGYSRFIIAGGETSGAIVEALGVRLLEIGPEIAPGVPWTLSGGAEPLALALKSGNFGGPDFFERALELLDD